MSTGSPGPVPTRSHHVSRRVALTAGLVLIPWTIYLGRTLRHRVGFWVRLDLAETAGLLLTAYLAYRQSRYAAWTARVTAGLLVFDAWVDVRSGWRHDDPTTALLMAIFLEIPLALGGLWWAHRISRSHHAQRENATTAVGPGR